MSQSIRHQRKIWFNFIQLLFWIFSLASSAQDTWERKTNFPEYRDRAVAFSIDGFGYAGTGSNGVTLKNDFWKYDPILDEWKQIDSIPTSGRRDAFSFVINGKAYVGGGINFYSNNDKQFWVYDPVTKGWNRLGDLPSGTYGGGNTTSFSINGKGYVLASVNTDNFLEYNPETDEWIAKSPFPGDAALGQVGFSIGNKGYIGTGSGWHGNLTEFWQYDPELDTWIKKVDFPGEPRSEAVGFSNDQFGYIGLGINRAELLKDFWEYNPETNSWKQIAANSDYVACNAFAFSIGLKGYVGTGIFSEGDEFWEYTPLINTTKPHSLYNKIELFPNPASDRIIVRHIDNQQNFWVSILSIQGTELMHKKEIKNNSLSVSTLPNGIYLIKIDLQDKSVYRKVVISR